MHLRPLNAAPFFNLSAVAYIGGLVQTIPLHARDGSVVAGALVDDEDYPALSRFRWHLAKGYARRKVRGQNVYMHREILGLKRGDRVLADHKSRNRLDNRRSNLRPATGALNGQNTPSRGGSSRHRGVSWCKRSQRWFAYAMVDGRQHSLGYFLDEDKAAAMSSGFRRAHMPYSQED